jgi:hypothetical protein
MGGGGKTSSNSTSTSTSGQNAIQGDNLGNAISGVNDSTINVTSTDHGAIEKAAQLGELAMTTLGSSTDKALDSVSSFAGSALNKYSASNSENLQMLAGLAGNQATQNEKNLEALAALSQSKADGGQVATSEQMTKAVMYVAVAAVAAFAITKVA